MLPKNAVDMCYTTIIKLMMDIGGKRDELIFRKNSLLVI